MVWCPDNQGAKRYVLMSRLTGKIQEEEMSAFGYQWKWKISKKLKRDREYILVILGVE